MFGMNPWDETRQMNTASRLLKFSRLSGLSFLHSHLSGEAAAGSAGEHLAKEYPDETHCKRWCGESFPALVSRHRSRRFLMPEKTHSGGLCMSLLSSFG
jgi:hypothetical protein